MSTMLSLILACSSEIMDRQYDTVARVRNVLLLRFSPTSGIHQIFFLGLESLNRDHHSRFKNATNHDTHANLEKRRPNYLEPQSSIGQLMIHQLCETMLQNRFLLRESLQSIHKHKCLKPFPSCGWKRKQPHLEFSVDELPRIEVSSAFLV